MRLWPSDGFLNIPSGMLLYWDPSEETNTCTQKIHDNNTQRKWNPLSLSKAQRPTACYQTILNPNSTYTHTHTWSTFLWPSCSGPECHVYGPADSLVATFTFRNWKLNFSSTCHVSFPVQLPPIFKFAVDFLTITAQVQRFFFYYCIIIFKCNNECPFLKYCKQKTHETPCRGS